ncbi:MAG TPA: substrate-binding domain-containing protein [Gemmatimonadaceae bacterium]|jgi:mxaJ protein|nr:substrate-binding domain-containing protein [Gemmatimonadaceae bacterium]
MSSRFRSFVRLSLAVTAISTSVTSCAHQSQSADRVFRVCADPNNLPFSNQAQQGFENRIAQLLAKDMGKRVQYTWWAQRRGFIRNTLNAEVCDVVMGVPSSFDLALVSAPYYRSTYVFVSRRDRDLGVKSFDDPVLRRARIGVQLVGDDGANTPPVHALSSRGIVGNLKGYTVYGDYSQPNPTARIMNAVENGEVDVAIVWGPTAGYFAKTHQIPLLLTPVSPQIDLPFLPFVYDISLAVRRKDKALRDTLDSLLVHERPAIGKILDEYGVPRVESVKSTAVQVTPEDLT